MSEANVEIARTLGRALETEGLDAAFAFGDQFFDDDMEWVEDPSWPGGGTYRGTAAIRELLRERTDSFDLEQHVERLIDAGDDVVTFVRWRGRGHSSGAEAEMRVATVTTFRDGKIVRVRFYLDRAEALAAVGLSGGPGV
jgi:ketosteroid isomerase-like protein